MVKISLCLQFKSLFQWRHVNLNAAPVTGGECIGWSNCTLVNQAGQCLTNVQSSHTISATYQSDDLIFADGFN